MTRTPFDPARIEAIAFDLLTALIDSWSLWIAVAGAPALGRAWRMASLRRVTGAGTYRPYEDILREATAEVGLPPARAEALLDSWGELQPWPEAPGVLRALAGRRLAVVTNCSQRLAERAAAVTGGDFEVVMSAGARRGLQDRSARLPVRADRTAPGPGASAVRGRLGP